MLFKSLTTPSHLRELEPQVDESTVLQGALSLTAEPLVANFPPCERHEPCLGMPSPRDPRLLDSMEGRRHSLSGGQPT